MKKLMGSLESLPQPAVPLKRENRQQWLHTNRPASLGQRSLPPMRSRFARLMLFKKIGYFQWSCSVAVFFLFVVVFQMFLPGSIMEKSSDFANPSEEMTSEDLNFLKNFSGLDDIAAKNIAEKFEALSQLEKFDREGVVEENGTLGTMNVVRFGYRKPKLALIFADLLDDSYQIQMATVASALREIGYDIEVFSLEDGPVRAVWRGLGFPLRVMETRENTEMSIDWLNYDGILVNSLRAVEVFSCLMQEPFKSVPLIWSIHEKVLATRLKQYATSDGHELTDNWRQVFRRAAVVVFPNYILPISYSISDAGNYFVIPSSPAVACKVDTTMALNKNNLPIKMEYRTNDFVIAVVGSPLMHRGVWLDHALVLKALLPVLKNFQSGNLNSLPKIIIVAGDLATNYSMALESIVQNLGYPKQIVKHVGLDEDSEIVLSITDIIIYSSFIEEQSFPDILQKAMCLGKPIVAPDLSVIKKYVDHKVNGYLFPKGNIEVLTQIMLEVVLNGKLSPLTRTAASIGKQTAKNLMVSETIEGYASLLDHVLRLPSEVAKPQAITEIPAKLKAEWQWHLFESIGNTSSQEISWKTKKTLDTIEEHWNHTRRESSSTLPATKEDFLYHIWEEQKRRDMANMRKRKEDEELKDRTGRRQGTWEEVYRNAKRADRYKNELHERDDGELERTGQPLCIYEPYFGEGIWPFLHRTSLYRGLGLSTKGRRPGADDIDAPSRLPLLNNPYYRNLLGECGAFFAIANRIDRIHKNCWIGFQSWRVTARKESLTKAAETSLLIDIEERKHGDTLYFWARMDMDPRNPLKQDFWTFCDAMNAGNCRYAFSEALEKMYGIKHNLSSLPPMPVDGGTWSVMHSWVLPTRSFVEFVVFSRMFVDALDVEFYDEHYKSGYCYLSLSKDKHCYSRVLELLVNVWAYHSARRMVYLNPKTGLMEEQHKLKSRKGLMWSKWFDVKTLKSMDEDLAEEFDTEKPKRRWLWPSTGEVFWQGIYEKERDRRNKEKEERKKKTKDKIARIKNRTHQKVLGKYVKPPPDELQNSNTRIVVAAKLLR